MMSHRAAFALSACNLALVLFTLGSGRTAAESTPPTLRGRALELVDERGQVRSRIDVEPSGEVVLRLLAEDGTIRVKLGAGRDGSGLVLLDEATEPAIHMVARRTGTKDRPTTRIALQGGEGRRRVLEP